MSVFNPNKTLNNSVMQCNGTNTVTINFDAKPELSADPADMVLIMDSSSSMAGSNLFSAIAAAKELIKTVSKASGSADGSAILNNSRMGIVSFNEKAKVAAPLTTSVSQLSNAITALVAAGSTNHQAAFEEAFAMLQSSTSARRIIIMFTDGLTTIGGDPIPVTENIKAAGIEIYCIGLTVTPDILNLWASVPNNQFVANANESSELDQAFAKIAAEVVKAGALDMVIQEVLNPDFKITNVNLPTSGTVTVLSPQSLEWKADAVATTGEETVSLSFDIMHIGNSDGIQDVNKAITYSDRNGSFLTFPNPKVTIDCQYPPIEENCPEPTELRIEGCQDAAVVLASDTVLSDLGRIVQVDATIKNVCPGKRVAVAILLSEVDDQGEEYSRGLKTILIQPQDGIRCKDLEIKCVNFVVPEALSVNGNTTSICGTRKFYVRVLANYVDTDFVCCDSQTVTL